jgi:transcriptional regulator with XRE-family HTH domain
MAIGKQNLVGPQVGAIRYRLELSQNELAARLARQGWDISRETLAKIETGVRCVTDRELVMLAKALKIGIEGLFPAQPKR